MLADRPRIPTALLFAVLLGWTSAMPAHGATADQDKNVAKDWPQWRGPNRNGVVVGGPKLLDSWPKDGPPLVWKSGYIPGICLGGAGSPVVADGKVYLYVNWKHPLEGGDKYHLITTDLLQDMGWIPDLPEDLARKLEEAWASPGRPGSVGWPWEKIDWKRFPKDKELDAFLAATPALDKYIKDFLAKLPPAAQKKFGPQIRRRLCICSNHGNVYGASDGLTWSDLVRLSAYRDKGFATYEEWMSRLGQDKIPFPGANLVPKGDLWERYAWFRCFAITDTVVCLDAATGKELWRQEFPEDSSVYMDSGHMIHVRDGFDNEGASATPAVVNGKCFAAGAMGLYCLSAQDGKPVWKVRTDPTHASPLVADGIVFHLGSAYDVQTGGVRWKQDNWPPARPYEGARFQQYPALLGKIGDTSRIVGASVGGYSCFDTTTGNVLGSFKGIPLLITDDLLICTDGAYAPSPAGLSLKYQMPNALRTEDAGSGLVQGDYRYAVFTRGEFQPNSMYCIGVKTGEVKWSEKVTGEFQISGMILVDGKIIRHSDKAHGMYQENTIEMVKATPEKYIPLGSFEPPALSAFSAPAVARGLMYVRLRDGVACYDLRAR